MNHCRDWSDVIRSDSGGKYWRWARLTVTNQELVNSRMIALVQEIRINYYSDPNAVVALLKSIPDEDIVHPFSS